MRGLRLGVVAALLGLGLWAWAQTGRPRPPQAAGLATVTVRIRQFAFEPPTVTIQAGGVVRWVNEDVVNHQISTGTVEGDRPRPDGRVSSGLFFRNETFTATFTVAGEYPYYCGVHPFMHGKIVVR